MMLRPRFIIFIMTVLAVLVEHPTAFASKNAAKVKQQAESGIRQIIEPLLSQYCGQRCKILSVNSEVEIVVPDELAPGFEEVTLGTTSLQVAPQSASAKILIDEMFGPVSRKNLLELLQKHLSGLGYPVNISTEITQFPQSARVSQQIAHLKGKVTKDFRAIVSQVFQQFCPNECLLGDFELNADAINPEEAQYSEPGEIIQEGEAAIKISSISGTLLFDNTLTPEERRNLLEVVQLKTNHYRNVSLSARAMKLPDPESLMEKRKIAAGLKELESEKKNLESKSSLLDERRRSLASENNKEEYENREAKNSKQELLEKVVKIERVEQGDQVQKELKKFSRVALIFAVSMLLLLVLLVFLMRRSSKNANSNSSTFGLEDSFLKALKPDSPKEPARKSNAETIQKRYEIDRLKEELSKIYSEKPKVAKSVFSRVLTEEGIEVTAAYIDIFGEGVILDVLRDPTLQRDLADLMEFYAKNQMDLTDDEKLDLLKSLYNRTVAAKMIVFGNRSSNLFDFLVDMDHLQIHSLIKNESLTVKAIVLTQCDHQKRKSLYTQFDEATQLKLLTELSRIDYLPRDYIYNVANALKRKRYENPRLNTEALPGSDVLIGLLENVDHQVQSEVIRSLEEFNPESARIVKGKLVSIETLGFLRDNQLLEVILSLKHNEILEFLYGSSEMIREIIYSKCPANLVADLQEELAHFTSSSKEIYSAVERKVLNRIKVLANDGSINLVDTNERMFSEIHQQDFIEEDPNAPANSPQVKKVAGW